MSSNCQTCTKKDTCIIFEKINNDNKASLYSSVYNLICDLNENKLTDEIINERKNYLNDAINRLSSIVYDLEDIADYLDDLK